MRNAAWRGVVAGVLLCLSACGGGSSGGEGGGSASELYYPLPANARWIYRHDDGSTVRVDALGTAQTAQGSGTQLVSTDDAGHLLDQTIAVSTSAGVTVYPSDTVDVYGTEVGALKLLAFPADAGQSFTQLDKTFTTLVDVDSDGVNETATLHSTVTVVGYDALDTPVGHLADVLHVRTDLRETVVTSGTKQSYPYRSVVDDWYAPRIGLVRSVETAYLDGVTPSPSGTTDLVAYRVADLQSERTPPAIASTAPADGARASTADVSVTFSEPVDDATLAAGWRIVDSGGQLLSGHVTRVGDTVHFVPDAGWHDGTYTSTISTAVTDLVGNALAQEATWSFTLDGVAPTVVSTTPADAATDVASTTPLVVQFSEPIDPATANANTVWLTDGWNTLPATYQVSGATLTVTPAQPWPRQKAIMLTLAAISDLAGNPMASAFGMSFVTDAGEFDYPVDLAAPTGTQAVAVADLDGDGRNDFVYTRPDFPAPSVLVRYGLPDGSLAAPVPLVADDASTCGLDGLIVTDLDGDGRQDVVVGGTWCGWHLLRQSAPRVFAVGESLAFSSQTRLRVADIDGDGTPELVSLQSTDAVRLVVWHQDASHRYADAPTLGSLPVIGGSNLDVADLDGDGRADLVISGIGFGGQDVAILRQQADGSFVQVQMLATGEGGANGVAVGDIDSDGRPDIVVTAGGNQPVYVAVFHQGADHVFGAPEHLPCLDIPAAVVVADVDGDGRPDVVITHAAWGHAGTFLQRADGTLGPESLYVTAYGSGAQSQLGVGDLTGDGRVDLVVDGQLLRQRTPDSGPLGALRVPGLAHVVRVPHRPAALSSRRVAAAMPSAGAPQ